MVIVKAQKEIYGSENLSKPGQRCSPVIYHQGDQTGYWRCIQRSCFLDPHNLYLENMPPPAVVG
jgi:hypothetical protein